MEQPNQSSSANKETEMHKCTGVTEGCVPSGVSACVHDEIITSLQAKVQGLACSVNHLTAIIEGMAIHLQEQHLKCDKVMDSLKKVQITLHDIFDQTSPATKCLGLGNIMTNKKRSTCCRSSAEPQLEAKGVFQPHFESSNLDEKGHVLPEYMRVTFKTKADMQLTVEEMCVAAYVFHPHKDQSEEVFQMGALTGTLKEIQTLRPDKIPSTKIVTLLGAKHTWCEEMKENKTVWVLPPAFSVDIRRGMTLDDIIDNYFIDWMTPYAELKFIYVPIEDCNGQWYMMVISLVDEVIYHLNPDMGEEYKNHRHQIMKLVGRVIAQMIATEWYPLGFAPALLQLEKWEISDAFQQTTPFVVTNPIKDKTGESILRVMDWLYMKDAFHPGSHSETNEEVEEVLRMRIAMDVLCGDHNQCWPALRMRSKAFWVQERYERNF